MPTKWTVDPRLWDDEKFCELEDGPQLVWLCLLTGPHRSSLPGLVRASAHSIAEVRRRPVGHIHACLLRLEEFGMIRRDDRARLIQIPKAPRYAPRPNWKHLMGWFKAWESLPESALKYAHIECLEEGLGLKEVMAHLRSTPGWVDPPPPMQALVSATPRGGSRSEGTLPPRGGNATLPPLLATWVGGFERARYLSSLGGKYWQSFALLPPTYTLSSNLEKTDQRGSETITSPEWTQTDLPYRSGATPPPPTGRVGGEGAATPPPGGQSGAIHPELGYGYSPPPRGWQPQEPVAEVENLLPRATNVVDLLSRLPKGIPPSAGPRIAPADQGRAPPDREPKGGPKPKTLIPDAFGLDEPMRAWCKGKGYPPWWVDNRLEHFRNVASAYGQKRADWRKAFMVFLVNESTGNNSPEKLKRPYHKKPDETATSTPVAPAAVLDRVRAEFRKPVDPVEKLAE